jgi:hypothetical protein
MLGVCQTLTGSVLKDGFTGVVAASRRSEIIGSGAGSGS